MNVLVMGGTRFNGLALVRELVWAGHEVTVLNRGKTEAVLPRTVQRLLADRKEHDQLRSVLQGKIFDCIIDVSAYTLDDVQSVVEITDGNCGHYIFISSTAIYDASDGVVPITEESPTLLDQPDYGHNKIRCEEWLFDRFRRSGYPASVAVLGMVYGPQNFIPDREQRMMMRLLLGRKVLIPGRGNMLSQIGHVEDEARALRLMMRNPRTFGQRYNVTGSDAYTAEAYVDLHAQALGVEAHKVHIPDAFMDRLWQHVPGKVDRSSGAAVPVPRPADAPDIGFLLTYRMAPYNHPWDASVFCSVDKLRAHTGWEPLFTTRTAIEQTAAWFLESGLDRTLQFDWSAEDRLLELIGAA